MFSGKLFIHFFQLLLVTLFLSGGACPSQSDSLVDEVKTLLDQGEFTQAATKADELVAAEDNPSNRLLAASAYTGKSSIDLLDLVGDFAGLIDSTVSDFKQIACLVQLSSPTAQLTDLRTAIERLEGIGATALAETANREAAFQLGMLQALESFILPTNRGAEPVEGTLSDCSTAQFTVDAATLDSISETDRVNVQGGFVESDNHLRSAQLDNDDEILEALFASYCRLKGASAADGFTREELQAFVWCELDTDSFPGGGFGSVANCAVFSDAAGAINFTAIDNCKNASDLILTAD